MNVDAILSALNRHQVRYLLIGGMNFLLRHVPLLTYDVDVWIHDTPDNRRQCEAALAELQAEWGDADSTWKPVSQMNSGWLNRQSVFCLYSVHGAIDVFRNLAGMDDWQASFGRAVAEKTAGGVPYWGLADADMLKCQYALSEGERKTERVRILEAKRKELPPLP